MRTPERKTISDVQFEVTPLGFSASRKLFVRLAKALAPAVSRLMVKDPAGALMIAVENLEDADLEYASEILGETTRFSLDGVKWPYLRGPDREVLFTGRLDLFFEWLAHALEVNYSGFFDALKKRDPAP